MMALGIESVVDRMANSRAQPLIMLNHRRSAAVSEDVVVLRNQRAKRMQHVGFDAGQRRRSINIPESYLRSRRPALQHALFQQCVVDSNAAVLDHQIGIASPLDQRRNISRRFVNNHLRITEIFLVPMLLPPICIRLGKGDLKSKFCQVFINATIIGCRAIPIGRRQDWTRIQIASLLEFLADCDQLLCAMRAGVSLQDGLPAVGADLPARRIVAKQVLNLCRHLSARFHHYVILSRPK